MVIVVSLFMRTPPPAHFVQVHTSYITRYIPSLRFGVECRQIQRIVMVETSAFEMV